MSSTREYSDVKALLEGMRVSDLHELLDERDRLADQTFKYAQTIAALLNVLADLRSKIEKTATGFEIVNDRNADVIDGFYRGALSVVLSVIDDATKPFVSDWNPQADTEASK